MNPFFDYFFYSLDIYEMPEGNNLLANFYFRLDVNQLSHQRIVFSFMDFVGDLGGVPAFLIQVGGWIVGSYSAFYASISMIEETYRVRQPQRSEKLFDGDKVDNDANGNKISEIHWKGINSLHLWLGRVSMNCRNKKHEKYHRILDICQERQDDEFNIVNIIK